ncbi:Vacuolar protein sorting-associated protein 25-like protein [Drosera capensis]
MQKLGDLKLPNFFNYPPYFTAGSLSHEAREAFLSALVAEGKNNGFEDSVMTIEELRTGVESRGTELHGMDRTVLMRALELLENKGELATFKGASTDDEDDNLVLLWKGKQV